jgi:dimethylargininase
MFKVAIARLPGENFADGLTTSNLGRPSYPLILEQHRAYVDTLRRLGLEVIVLPAEAHYPDAYFTEDTAIVTPHVAVITRPGAKARRGEEATIEPVLARYRPIERIAAPGTVDGGDVLMVENHFFIGLSERTNQAGAEQLGGALEKYGHTWEAVPVGAGLHLKSSVNYIGKNTLLLTQALVEYAGFAPYEKILIDPDEEYAANTLWVNDCLLTPRGFPKTRQKLSRLQLEIIELDVSEVRKMDGGLTCMSLRFGL